MVSLRGIGIGYRYRGGVDVLSGVDIAPAAGALTALTGPSGRGKSTLLFVLGLLLRPQSGRVLVGEQDAQGLSDAARARIRARHIGFVFQDSALDLGRSIVDNVVESTEFAPTDRGAALARAASLLAELQVDVPSGRRAVHLSGGQAQRVALCRALLPDPHILLADEPTGNLDEVSAGVVLDRLRHEADRGRIVVIATHDTRVLGRCDEVVRL